MAKSIKTKTLKASPETFYSVFEGTERGQQVLMALEETFNTNSCFAPEATTMAYLNGQRDVVLFILGQIGKAVVNDKNKQLELGE